MRGLLMGRHRSPADTRNAFDGHSWDLAGIDRVWRETAGRAPAWGQIVDLSFGTNFGPGEIYPVMIVTTQTEYPLSMLMIACNELSENHMDSRVAYCSSMVLLGAF